jgi:hypothetical protein
MSQGNIVTEFRDPFEDHIDADWTIVTQGSDDIVKYDGNAAGASYRVISLSPLTQGTETRLETPQTFGGAVEIGIGLHASQRTLGQELILELVSDETDDALAADVAISSISQATTTLSVTTATAHNLKVGSRIGIRGVNDSRFNYPSLVVATTPTATTFTVTAGPSGTIASVTAGPFVTGFVYMRSAVGGARNGSSMLLENATATNASFYVKSNGSEAVPLGGTLAGNHSITIASTASIQAANSADNYAFRPTTEFRAVLMSDRLQWSDGGVDITTQTTSRALVTQTVPSVIPKYKLRFRAVNSKALSVPVAQIVTAAKTGTTTATITTNVAHGLTTADLITIYGIRDQAASSFPNLLTATAVASVIDATSFTVVIGTAATVTSRGGYVARVNGGNLPSALGAIAQVVQSVARASNVLTVIGSASWVGLLIGDYVNLVGVRLDSDGSPLGVDGAYRVRDLAATTLSLEPIGNAPTGGTIVTTNCGGGVIKRTDLRVSFARVLDFKRFRTEPLARPLNDMAAATPVVMQGGTLPAVTAVTTLTTLTGSAIAEDAATTANPLVVGGVVRTAAAPLATPVAGDAIRATFTTDGRLVTSPFQYPEATWSYAAAASGIVNTTTAVTIKATAAAGLRNYVSSIDLMAEALTNATEVAIRDGAGGTVIWRTKIGTAGLLNGRPIRFDPPLRPATAASLLEVVTLTASGAGAVYFNASGFVAP